MAHEYHERKTTMTQSIIIFVIIVIVQAIAAGIAKKKEAEKKAALENQRLGRTAERPAPAPTVRSITPKRDLFAAAQAKAERKAAGSAPLGSPSPILIAKKTFTSVVGAIHEVKKVSDLGGKGAQPASGRFSRQSRPQPLPLRMIPLHTAEGEATAAQLSRTVTAIHDGMLRKDGEQAKATAKKWQAAAGAVRPNYRIMSRSIGRVREAIVMGEILGTPLSLRQG